MPVYTLRNRLVKQPIRLLLFNSHGRLWSGIAPAITVIAPFINPDAPIPVMARPPINIDEELATPHIKDPSSKMAKNIKKVGYISSILTELTWVW